MDAETKSKLDASCTYHDICTICLEELYDLSKPVFRKPETGMAHPNEVFTLRCTHKFHFGCIQKWFVSHCPHKCPICRQCFIAPFPPPAPKRTDWHTPSPVTDDWGTPPAGGIQSLRDFRQNDSYNQWERKVKRDFWLAHYGHFLPNIP